MRPEVLALILERVAQSHRNIATAYGWVPNAPFNLTQRQEMATAHAIVADAFAGLADEIMTLGSLT